MVVAKGKAITQRIRYMKKGDDHAQWVITFDNDKTYTYRACNVRILDQPENLDPSVHKVFYQGKVEYHVDIILKFKDEKDIYYRVV